MKVSAPGKLFLSGEWAVLEPGNPGIVAAVNKRVHAELQPAKQGIQVSIDDFGILNLPFTWQRGMVAEGEVDEEKIKFLKAAVETSLRFLEEHDISFRPFSIKTWGDQSQVILDGKTKKVGFGSSAASVVAVVAGVLKFHEYQATKEEIYKLAALVHYYAQGKVGSAFDVAASTFGGVFVYERFQPDWLIAQATRPLKDIVARDWPGLRIDPLPAIQGLDLIVGWTKSSASTSAMVKQLNIWAKDHQQEYHHAFGQIASLVKEVIDAWRAGDQERVLSLVRKNEPLLRELGQQAGVPIETPDLKQLSDLANRAGGAGKLSGAGGGDCGIALSFDPHVSDSIRIAWKAAGFYVIDTKIDWKGVE